VLEFDTPLPVDGTIRVARIAGPDADEALALGRRLSFERDGAAGDRVLELYVAEDTEGIRAANTAFRVDLVRALAILAVALVGATWVQVTLGLSPLGMIKRGIAAIRTGRAKTLDGNYPAEVMPLVSEVNDLLQTQDRSIEFARTRAADLAHGLKTSLTLLNGEAHDLRRSGNANAAAAIEKLTAGMSEVIDHQLRLSRLRHRTRSDFRSTPVASVAEKVIAALKKTPEGRALEWLVDIPQTTVIALDGMDLTELLGVYLENATKWARHKVSISARTRDGKVAITIADDGPGLDDAALATLGTRGRRLDETRPGSGLGLAIGREIVALNSGELSFCRAPTGGLQVDVVLYEGPAG
jgi:signal transduction histidine kinase